MAANIGKLLRLDSESVATTPQAALSQRAASLLASDVHLRFGTVDAVFMQALDSELHQLPASRPEDAIKLLRSRSKLSGHTAELAASNPLEQGTSTGEALLLGQYVTPRDWCLAVMDARLALVLDDSSTQPRTIVVVLPVIVSLVALVQVL